MIYALILSIFKIGDSDVESALIRDGPDLEYASETLKKHQRKGIRASNSDKSLATESLKRTTTDDKASTPVSSTTLSEDLDSSVDKSAITAGRKRGRPIGSRKTENQENLSPPLKSRRGRKSKTSSATPVSSTQSVSTVTVLEPVDSVVPQSESSISDITKSPPHELPTNPPPKKLFKNKATLKEVSSPPNESTNFKNWLDAKLSPTKPLSDPTSVSLPLPNGLGPDGKKHLNDELSRTPDTPEAAPTVIKVRLGKSIHDIVDLRPVFKEVKLVHVREPLEYIVDAGTVIKEVKDMATQKVVPISIIECEHFMVDLSDVKDKSISRRSYGLV